MCWLKTVLDTPENDRMGRFAPVQRLIGFELSNI